MNTGTEPPHNKEAGIRIFPNPAPDAWTVEIELPQAESLRFELYDQLGRLVRSWNKRSLTPGINRVELGNSGLPAGAYLLKVRSDKWQQSLKIAH